MHAHCQNSAAVSRRETVPARLARGISNILAFGLFFGFRIHLKRA
jgi:hypothetical protein